MNTDCKSKNSEGTVQETKNDILDVTISLCWI